MRAAITNVIIDLTETSSMYIWNIFSLSLADTTVQENAFQDQRLKADSFNLSPSCLTNTDIFSVKHFGMSFTIPRHFFSRGQNCIQCFFLSYVYTQVMGDTHKGKLISTISWEILGDPLCCFQSRATTVRQKVRKRERLCVIRRWDRKSCRVCQD